MEKGLVALWEHCEIPGTRLGLLKYLICGLNDYWSLPPPVKDSYSGTAVIHEATILKGRVLGSLFSVAGVIWPLFLF